MSLDVCPGENATECLLRALLAAQLDTKNEINWDPISLGFTAIIGVLALLFAILTVVQGVLAAGPRNLKAGESAIGWYSKFSKSSFSMSEMRVRSVAYTPILQTNILQMYNLKRHSLSSKIRKGPRILRQNTNTIGPHPPASWVVLMEHTNIIDVRSFDKKTFYTDYLPRDLLAPPAYAEVLCISVLALLSGCTTLNFDEKRYPHIEGLYTRLYFRDHAELGDVAVFQHFPDIHGCRDEKGPDILAVQKAFWSAQGYLSFDDVLIKKYFSHDANPDAYLRIGGELSDAETGAILRRMRTALPRNFTDKDDKVYESAFGGAWEYAGILLGSVDVLTTPAYPTKKIGLGEIVKELGMDLGILPIEKITSEFLNPLAEEFSSRSPGHHTIVLDFIEARNLIKWIQAFEGPNQPTRSTSPSEVSPSGVMLSMLDHFLGSCAPSITLQAYWDILATKVLAEQGPLPKGVSVAHLELLQGPRPEIKQLAFVKRLLWLRAVCLAGFLQTLPDTTLLVDTDLGRRLVPVL
ncbi:hypothetical protein TWF569_005657 [Orbilia oligospora]|uniref:Uncharacterized protein n=1 Tax=Orbilia oligospora TaxID=2813651 RepID=A0A7C8MV25_ORBOL|nr:hypothetical protein TWF102_002879 [Orbilia oligospora]KAF3098414.1 hypothetical protein TWF706_006845 [Orbilia oligospora]KAF3134632.1 hypothetical protein TWF703_006289 [Orbilia oligospora]KAF3156682.1 hypothetical protein TWF569_005657 [Orbilia oligospora]